MCGISGIIDKNNKNINKSDIKKINDIISHRGPDSEGFFYENNFALGHRRLSIIDLTSDGHQPMHYNDRYTITYNGEIYNYLEIKETLISDGYTFNSNSDTEVILASYAKWGSDCVKEFNGMWAFAIYDRVENILFCSRDRFGIKPFYYTIADDKFIFGSEIKQLLEFYPQRYVNKTILLDYLMYGLIEHTEDTFFENIHKLQPSCNLLYDLSDHTYKVEQYYRVKLDDNFSRLSDEQSASSLNSTLQSAINLRLRSDVKVGACLSGGLDSSSIVAIASQEYLKNSGNRFCAIHAKSVEKKTDESHYAKEVAEHCNIDLIVTEPELDDITKVAQEVVYTQEEPFGGPSIFMQYFVMKEAKRNGLTVMLDGQGGDETLFGYEYYFAYYFASLVKQLKFIKYFKDLREISTFRLSKKAIVKESIVVLIRDKISFLERYLRAKRIKLKVEHNPKNIKSIFKFDNFKDMQIQEIIATNLPQLLKYEDKNSMRSSIETRLPMLDFRFVQQAISIKDELKFKDGYLKYLLRVVADKILPKNIVWRKSKFGFEAPTDTWIDKNFDNMVEEISKSSLILHILDINSNLYKNKLILWRLYNIALWERVYGVKIR